MVECPACNLDSSFGVSCSGSCFHPCEPGRSERRIQRDGLFKVAFPPCLHRGFLVRRERLRFRIQPLGERGHRRQRRAVHLFGGNHFMTGRIFYVHRQLKPVAMLGEVSMDEPVRLFEIGLAHGRRGARRSAHFRRRDSGSCSRHPVECWIARQIIERKKGVARLNLWTTLAGGEHGSAEKDHPNALCQRTLCSAERIWSNSGFFRAAANSGSCLNLSLSLNPSSRALRM